jgi:hypothetical protein
MPAAILRDARGQSPRAPQDEGCGLLDGCAATISALILRSLGLQGQGSSKDGRKINVIYGKGVIYASAVTG